MKKLGQFLHSLFHTKPAATRAFPKVHLTLEALEDRELMSASPVAPAALIPIPYSTTSMTALAQQLHVQPTGPTQLFINFSGWTNTPYASAIGTSNLGPFTGSLTDKAQILYQTAEEFAPFNVQVQEIVGNGVFSDAKGATTVFVGQYSGSGETPAQFMDYPSLGRGTSHVPNSDLYGIAFVPQSGAALTTSQVQDVKIVNAIAHEAGHTFGLAHVRTDGMADYPTNQFNGLTDNPDPSYADVMSYDSSNDFFHNTTFNVTEANGPNPNTSVAGFPQYANEYVTQQNSFTYLQTVLGARPATSQVDVVDEGIAVPSSGGTFRILNLVDPGYFQSPNTPGQNVQPASINAPSVVNVTIGRTGDYQAFKLNLLNSNWPASAELAVTPFLGSTADLMILDETGLQTSTVVGAAGYASPLVFLPQAGHTYFLVVSATAGTHPGTYTLGVGPLTTILPNGTNTFTVKDANQKVVGQVTLSPRIGFNGQYNGFFTLAGVSTAVPVTGTIGGQINGAAIFQFSGAAFSSKTIEWDAERHVTDTTTTKVTFQGRITQNSLGYSFSGQGDYNVTVVQTSTDPRTNQGFQTTSVLANIPFASGNDVNVSGLPGAGSGAGSGLPVSGSQAANMVAAPASGSTGGTNVHVAALDAVMANLSANTAPASPAKLATRAKVAALDVLMAHYSANTDPADDLLHEIKVSLRIKT